MKKLLLGLAVVGAGLPAYAAAQDADAKIGGLRVEARATYETPTVSSVFDDGDVYKLGSAFAFGAEIGYDAPLGNWTVGPYAQYEISSVEQCDGTDCVAVEDYLEVGGSVGYAVAQSGLLYGKLGYGEMGLEASIDGESGSVSIGGPAFALGYQHNFGGMLYGRVEGGYADLGDDLGFDMQRRHFGVALGARF